MTTMRRVPGGAGEKFRRTLQEMDNANVRVGWFESSKYPDEHQTPVAYIAAINELGPHARPFMRTTAEMKDVEWSAQMLQFCRQVVKGKWTVEQALTAMGLVVGGDIQQMIASITQPELSLITLLARKARKNGEKVTGATIGEFAARVKKDPDAVRAEVAGINTKPLNDTGYMLATVSFSVNEKSATAVNENAS